MMPAAAGGSDVIRVRRDEFWLGAVWLVVLSFVAARLPKQRLYRPAGYVHVRTFDGGYEAPLHQHDKPKAGHIQMYRRAGQGEV